MTVFKQLFIIGLLALTTDFPAMGASTDDAGCSYEYFTPVPEAGAQELNGKLYGEITLSREYEPGWYYLTIPYQTEGDRNAQFAAFVVCSGQPRSNVSPWQHFSTSNKWTTLVMVVKLERKIVPVLIFNKSETMGKIDKLLVKTPVLTPVSLPPGTNWFQGNGYFQGVDGELPVGWTHNYTDMSPAVNGLTADFGFEQSTRVMKLGGSDNAPATLESVLFPFPDGGEVEFSVWAKSVDGPARINMLLLGDDYKWSASERFQLSEKWQKYTVRCAVPKKIEKTPYLWCRIDIEKGQHALLGRVELKQPPQNQQCDKSITATNPAISGNLITNPDFELGCWGWTLFYGGSNLKPDELIKRINSKEPKVVDGGVNGGKALWCDPFTCLTSFCFPLECGKIYTISAYLKNAIPGQTSECTILVIDNKWQYLDKKFQLTDQWQRYSFSFDWNFRSRRGVSYMRLDSQQNPVLMDKLEVAEGGLADFTVPPVQLGLVTAEQQPYNVFNDTDRQAVMMLNAVCRQDVTGKIKIKADITDAWGKNISHREFEVAAAPMVKLPMLVNPDGIRGVFHVALTAFNDQEKMIGYGESRYAVCRDLSGKQLPDNPMSGHFEMLKLPARHVDILMPLLNRYLPANDFNRCFIDLKLEQIANPELLKEYCKLFKHWSWQQPVKKIMVMELLEKSKGQWAKTILEQADIPPEAMAKYLECVKEQVTAFKGSIDGWELFNEPNLWKAKEGTGRGNPSMPPEKVAQLYKAAYPVIKGIDPSILVVGPCANGESFLTWSESFLKAGGAGNFDVFSFHGYSDSPDLFDMYGRIKQAQTMLEKYGMTGVPVWNTEQYYAARVPAMRLQEEEYYRSYFRDREIDAAAALVSNLIHHAAAGSRLGMFEELESNTIHGPNKEFFLYDFFAAGNFAVEQLGTAGTGEKIELGTALKCFLFPRAQGGPLATINAIDAGLSGKMALPSGVKAFDMMGNAIDGLDIAITNIPVYLHFPAGTSGERAAEQLRNSRFLGLGNPFSLSLAMDGKEALCVTVINRLNQTVAGTVTMMEIPSGWTFDRNNASFSELEAGGTAVLKFRITSSDLKQLASYRFKFSLKTDKEYFTSVANLSAVFAAPLPDIKGDGNLDAWRNASWFTLGSENTSTKFDQFQGWAGPQDLTAEVACGWNAAGLGIAVIVTDDQFCFPKNPGQCWEHDSIQLYFDMKKDATAESAARKTNAGDDVSYQIGYVNGNTAVAYLDHAPDGRFIGAANQQQGIDNDVTVTCRKLTQNRLLYDIFLPRKTLPLVKLQGGASLGFSLLINDNDGKGRKTGLTLAPKGKEPFNNPHEYRDLIMIP